MTKICLGCKQELPIDLFRLVMVKGEPKRIARCNPCAKAYQKAYYEANKEHCKELMRAWNKRNADYVRDWRANNPDKVAQYRKAARPRAQEYMREQYWKDPEAARLKSKQFREANPELIKAKKKEWNSSNREHLRAYYNTKTAQLSDSYIRNKLAANHERERTLRSEEIPQALVEIKRFQLLIQRELRNEKRRSTT